MNLKITEEFIKNICDSNTYTKGRAYFFQDRVGNISIDPIRHLIEAKVIGQDYYDVRLSFNEHGFISGAACTCPAFYQYSKPCKHIIATLFSAKKYYGSDAKAPTNQKIQKNKSISHAPLFEYFTRFVDSKPKTEIKLELILSVYNSRHESGAELELKVGEDRTYVVKNMYEFLESIDEERKLYFGKTFEYNPDSHTFSEEDNKIIELLLDIYDEENKKRNTYYGNFPRSLSGKKARITERNLTKLLRDLGQKNINILINDREIGIVHKTNEKLDIKYRLKSGTQTIDLDIENISEIYPLLRTGEFILYKDKIYHLSKEDMKIFIPFFIELRKDTELKFGGSERERLLSEVLPYLKQNGIVAIDREIEKSILQSELITKVYFDCIKGGISAKVEFCYEDIIIDPFFAKTKTSSDKFLVRDIKKEKDILEYFEDTEFTVNEGKLNLLDEDKVYDFVYNKLKSLNDIAEVYYSDDFKKLKIVDKRAFKGGIKLNHDSDMLEFSFSHDNIPPNELSDILRSIKQKKKYHRLKDGSFLPIDETMSGIADMIENLDIKSNDLQKKVINLPKFRALYLDSSIKNQNLTHIERSLPFKQLVQNIKEPQDMDFFLPDTLDTIMRDYQKTGYKWLKTLSMYGMGGILADDMGLGKTLQTLAFISSNRISKEDPVLIIAPTSLVYNWVDEANKFTPELRCLPISGQQQQRAELLDEIGDIDIVITSYPLIRRDIELYSKHKFSYCILDEAQQIKNPESVNAKCVKEIKAKGYFALTGTPIENSLTELWSIFDFIMPGYLHTHSKFLTRFEKPIVKEGSDEVRKQLISHISPFIMRRLKKDVLEELPDKIETRMTAELSDEQKKYYLAYMEEAKSTIAKEIKQNGFQKSQIKILSILTRLRQICCHPGMFVENYNGGSGKLELLGEIIEEALSGGHRILIFSQFTSMLSIIAKELTKDNVSYFYLDGSTKMQQRGDMVRSFNAGENSVFLISLKAGGTGLNLTGADTVIHVDPWWNPAVEDQATDRAYRIGQTNKVQVIKLITSGTIEEKVFMLQQKKKNLIESVIQDGETFINKLSEDEIRALFE